MRYFQDKVVLLTGANGGLGCEMARQLAAAGARLILTDISPEPVFRAAHVLGYIPSDLINAQGCEELAKAALALSRHIDVLINNAGIASAGRFIDTPDAVWRAQIAVNLIAPLHLTRLFLPGMLERGAGHIVQISSMGGHIPTPLAATYAATKFGLRGFGTGLRHELRASGVAVSVVYPSFTRTPIIEAERFGNAAPGRVPEFLISEPAPIVRRILRKVAQRRPHVYPTLGDWLVSRIVGASDFASALLTRLLVRLAG